jgi:hypothetical protein
MPFNGSGSYSLPYNWQTDAANGLNQLMQGQDADIAAALSICLTKDGQQQVAANLQMGGFTLTNMANASAQKQPISVQDFQNGTPTWLGTVSGTDTITGAANIAPAAYARGQRFRGVTAGANTTNAVTLNVNGLGAKPVVKNGAVALAVGDLAAGQVFEVTYDGTNFQISGSTGGRGSLLNIQRITATGTYTPTPGANAARVRGAGSGGAGGGGGATASAQTAGGGGGSSGAYGEIWIAKRPHIADGNDRRGRRSRDRWKRWSGPAMLVRRSADSSGWTGRHSRYCINQPHLCREQWPCCCSIRQRNLHRIEPGANRAGRHWRLR